MELFSQKSPSVMFDKVLKKSLLFSTRFHIRKYIISYHKLHLISIKPHQDHKEINSKPKLKQATRTEKQKQRIDSATTSLKLFKKSHMENYATCLLSWGFIHRPPHLLYHAVIMNKRARHSN